MRISDWSSDVCSSDLRARHHLGKGGVDMLAIGVAGKILQPAAGGIETEAGGDATADQAKAVPQAASAAMHLDQRQVAEIGRAHVELQSLMRISYAVFCLKKKKNKQFVTHDTDYKPNT